MYAFKTVTLLLSAFTIFIGTCFTASTNMEERALVSNDDEYRKLLELVESGDGDPDQVDEILDKIHVNRSSLSWISWAKGDKTRDLVSLLLEKGSDEIIERVMDREAPLWSKSKYLELTRDARDGAFENDPKNLRFKLVKDKNFNALIETIVRKKDEECLNYFFDRHNCDGHVDALVKILYDNRANPNSCISLIFSKILTSNPNTRHAAMRLARKYEYTDLIRALTCTKNSDEYPRLAEIKKLEQQRNDEKN